LRVLIVNKKTCLEEYYYKRLDQNSLLPRTESDSSCVRQHIMGDSITSGLIRPTNSH